MKTPGLPRALLVAGGLVVAVLAGIGTAGSFGSGGTLWGDQYDPEHNEASPDWGSGAALNRGPVIRAEIQSRTDAFQEALDNRDLQDATELYTAGAVTSAPGQPPAQGREAIRAAFGQTVPQGGRLTIDRREIQVLSPEWAVQYATATITPSQLEEAGVRERSATLFQLFHKTESGWKVVREAVSPNGREPGTR